MKLQVAIPAQYRYMGPKEQDRQQFAFQTLIWEESNQWNIPVFSELFLFSAPGFISWLLIWCIVSLVFAGFGNAVLERFSHGDLTAHVTLSIGLWVRIRSSTPPLRDAHRSLEAY